MTLRHSTATDWISHAQWLCHRLSVVDGRLNVPKPVDVIDLGRQLTASSVPESWSSGAQLQQQMKCMGGMIERMGLRRAHWYRAPRLKALPMVGLHPQHGLCLISEGQTHHDALVFETPLGPRAWGSMGTGWVYCSVALGWREQLELGGLGLALRVLMRHRWAFLKLSLLTLAVDAAIAAVAYALAVNFEHAMVGIDRQALTLLGLGAGLSIGLSSLLDVLRRAISTRAAMDLDTDLARQTYERLLKVRVGAVSPNTDSMAMQVQLFESVRSFTHTALTHLVLDIPIALFFWCVIGVSTSPALAGLAALYVLIKLTQGLGLLWRSERIYASIEKPPQGQVGLMMATLGYAETVKSLGLRALFQHRFSVATQEQIKKNQEVQRLTDVALNDNPGLRQLGFIAWLLMSVYLIDEGTALSLGAWTGSSMLVTRVIHPVSSLPTLCVQWLQAKLALRSIDRIFKLQVDHSEPPGVTRSEVNTGQILLQDVFFVHPQQHDDLTINNWLIKPGERVGIVGDMGGGKSTLLKLMAGLYKPQRGLVQIDQHSAQELPRDWLSRRVAYLPQSVQIFSGTLRENLMAGLKGVPDEHLLQICQRVGLMALVNSHALGLNMPLQEGPNGLSMGQRQLVGWARLLLRDPLIWLLDDPLANLDEPMQKRMVQVLSQHMAAHQTLVVVGQQTALLALVQRVAVLRAGRMVMDGPRGKVLSSWRSET
jgi:ATP-binding cassette subfamily C protein LapB